MSQAQVEVLNEDTPSVLTLAEEERLEVLEKTIKENLAGFFVVGMALLEIRKKELYRRTHSSFGEYCRHRYEIALRTAQQYIGSASAMNNILKNAQVTRQPKIESHLLPLVRLSPEVQIAVWRKVEEECPVGRITASLVSKIVTEMVGVQPKTKSSDPTATLEAKEIETKFKKTAGEMTEILRAGRDIKWQGVNKRFIKDRLLGIQRFVAN